MKWQDIDAQTCSIARASALLGDRWTLVILRDCMFGIKRFDDFVKRTGLPRATLTKRLQNLIDTGILELRARPASSRNDYHLTEMGRDLVPVFNALTSWGDKHLTAGDGLPIIRRHKSCGHDILPVVACPECGEEITAGSIEARPGPGMRPETFRPATPKKHL